MSKKYVAYCRVSTKKQGRSGLGLEVQEEIIKYNVGEQNIVTWYKEVHSGKDLDVLPEFQKAKKRAKDEGYVLVIAKTDRLRNTQQALDLVDELTPEGVFFCNLGRNADKFMLTLFFAFAEKERLEISLRTKLALRTAMGNGACLGMSSEKYGQNQSENDKKQAYENRIESIRRSKGNKALKNENLKQAYRFARYLRDEGKTPSEIAVTLNNEGHKTSMGGSYSITQVTRLFKRFDQLTPTEVF